MGSKIKITKNKIWYILQINVQLTFLYKNFNVNSNKAAFSIKNQ